MGIIIVRPWQTLHHVLGLKKSMVIEVSHHSPDEVLKNFKEVQNLRIELLGGELGIEDGVMLKWKAMFGSTLESFVILGASSVFNPAKDKRDGNCDSKNSWLLQGKRWFGLLKSIMFVLCFWFLVLFYEDFQ